MSLIKRYFNCRNMAHGIEPTPWKIRYSRPIGSREDGSFANSQGISETLDLSIPSTCHDENGTDSFGDKRWTTLRTACLTWNWVSYWPRQRWTCCSSWPYVLWPGRTVLGTDALHERRVHGVKKYKITKRIYIRTIPDNLQKKLI